MTTAAATLPDTLKTRDSARRAAYAKFLAFYTGAQYPNAPRRTKLRRLTVNYTRVFVKKVSSYVMKGVTVAIEPLGEDEEQLRRARAAEDAWREISANNGLPGVDMATEIDCAVLGDAAYKVTWDRELARVAITAVDVAGLYVWPHPFDPLRFRRLAYTYQLTAEELLFYWNVVTAKNQVTVTEDWTDELLTVWIDTVNTPVIQEPNPYEFIPFVVYPNERVPKQWWGESDIDAIYEMAQEFNAEYSRLSNIMELTGNPLTIVSGVDEATGLESYPGAVWELPGGARAEVLDALRSGAGAAHLAYIDDIRLCLHDLSETPRTAFGDNEKQVSGVALEVDLEPLLQKAERKRAIRSEAYAARAGMAFAISDQFAGTDLLDSGRISIEWQPLTPRDRTRDIADEVMLTTNGLSSTRSALARLGEADPDTELAAIAAETPDQPVDNNA